MFLANSLDMIDIVMQVVCLLRAEWIVLMYMLQFQRKNLQLWKQSD